MFAQICKVVSVLVCVRWIAIGPSPILNGIYQCGQRIALSAFVAGLFDAVGCGRHQWIYRLFFADTTSAVSRLFRDAFSDWRLGHIAGAYVVYRQLVLSVLRLKSRAFWR